MAGDELEEVLTFHGIKKKDIERHVPLEPAPKTREPESIERTAEEMLGVEDHVE